MNRILGIDYGEVRVGIAISDLTHTIASPFKTFTFKDYDDLLLKLSDLIKEKDITEIVVGLPLNMKGKITKQTLKVHEFINLLKSSFSNKIYLIDERLSSITAKKIMHEMNIKTGHNKEKTDQISASIILQEYLDSVKE